MTEEYPKVYLYRRTVQRKLFIDRDYVNNLDVSIISDQTLEKFNMMDEYLRKAVSIVEVFKTTISSQREANLLKRTLLRENPEWRINFDLEDCDRILRIEGEVINNTVISVAKSLGITVDVLPD